MKKSILIFALSRSPWIGGIYYRKNITNMLIANEQIINNYQIVILTNEKYKHVFESFMPRIKLITSPDGIGVAKAMLKAFNCCLRYRVKYVFPLMPYKFLKIFGITPVSWIADFQHCHYPDFFERKEIEQRNFNFSKIAKAKTPLILSSNDALNDFRNFYSVDRKGVYVVHFSSCINDEIKKLALKNEDDILNRFGLLNERYAVICNQFWQHKNHKVVLEMIKKYIENGLIFVFTGEPNDRRNPEYIIEIQNLLNDKDVINKVRVLGFIERIEQICIMKHAQFVIQPSLFEGWGTVVEDGKILGKRMILSDIPVHFEQKNENCLLFEKNSSESLLNAVLQMERDSQLIVPSIEADLTKEYSSELGKVFV